MLRRFSSFLLLLISSLAFSQDQVDSTKSTFWKDHFQLNGYVKFMQSFSGDQEGNIYDQSLWHNRLNSKLFINSNHEIALELRNRVFYGEAVGINPEMKSWLGFDNGAVDLSYVAGQNDKFLYSGIIDRFYYKGVSGNWEWSVGRQRINWGINTYFNANDIFNAFTFTDFDYEERPGSDAARVQKYFKNGSDLEVAAALYSDTSYVVGAKYGWNKWDYDFQVLLGKYYSDYVVGGGWAGNIKNIGFKGEVAYFLSEDDQEGAGSISFSGEYLFNNGKFLGIGGLYSSGGVSGNVDVSSSLLAFQTSAKNLMPTRWSNMVTFGGELNDLSSFAIVGLYMPEVDFMLIMPSLTYSMAQNFDLSIHMINVAGVVDGDWIGLANGFVRANYSF